jgi:GNAT superfamily N-acetyltransferase
MTAKGLTVVGPSSMTGCPRMARQHQEKGLSKTFVAIDEANPSVICAYYALTLTEIDSSLMPADKRSKFPRRIPGVRLARLAVSLSHQKKGLGELLLVNALERAKRIHTEAGGIGLFVDAIDEHAAAFYRHYGFVASPEQPLLMFLSVGALS